MTGACPILFDAEATTTDGSADENEGTFPEADSIAAGTSAVSDTVSGAL